MEVVDSVAQTLVGLVILTILEVAVLVDPVVHIQVDLVVMEGIPPVMDLGDLVQVDQEVLVGLDLAGQVVLVTQEVRIAKVVLGTLVVQIAVVVLETLVVQVLEVQADLAVSAQVGVHVPACLEMKKIDGNKTGSTNYL